MRLPFPQKQKFAKFHEEVTAGAFGGVPSRTFPSVVLGSVFGALAMGNIPSSGIAPRIAFRPPSAQMLKSSDYHTNIPTASGFVGQSKAVAFGAHTSETTHPGKGLSVHPSVSRHLRQPG